MGRLLTTRPAVGRSRVGLTWHGTGGVIVIATALIVAMATPATAAWTGVDDSAPSSVSTASLSPAAWVTANRHTDGTVDLEWARPVVRPDVDPAYALVRSVDGVETDIAVDSGSTTLVDDVSRPATSIGGRVEQVEAGHDHTCALVEGDVYCWGSNGNGRLGNGTTTSSTSPVKVVATWGEDVPVTRIAAGTYHTCAIANGDAYCWGFGGDHQIGRSPVVVDNPLPVLVGPAPWTPGTVTQIETGYHHTCAVAEGRAYCWGYNGHGRTGLGLSDGYTSLPSAVVTDAWGVGAPVDRLFLGPLAHHTCAIVAGTAYCWGLNSYGRLGDNTEVPRTTPVTVKTRTGETWMPGAVTAIEPDFDNTCAIADGKAYCWGYNGDYQSGNGTAVSTSYPVPVSTAAWGEDGTVSEIKPGYIHTCAVVDSKAYCWGHNPHGGIGNNAADLGVIVTTPTPVDVTPWTENASIWGTTTDVLEISSSIYSTCANTGGNLYCWGLGSTGKLGHGSTSDKRRPNAVLAPWGNYQQVCETDWAASSAAATCVPTERIPISYRLDYGLKGWRSESVSVTAELTP